MKLSNISSKMALNTKNAFFACFWAYVVQPHGHICRLSHIKALYINQNEMFTKIIELAIMKNSVIWVSHFFSKIVFASFPWKLVKGSWMSRMGQFWWLPWFQAKNHSPKIFQPPVYKTARMILWSKITTPNFFLNQNKEEFNNKCSQKSIAFEKKTPCMYWIHYKIGQKSIKNFSVRSSPRCSASKAPSLRGNAIVQL